MLMVSNVYTYITMVRSQAMDNGCLSLLINEDVWSLSKWFQSRKFGDIPKYLIASIACMVSIVWRSGCRTEMTMIFSNEP